MNSPETRKVIIRGHIFNYEEKAPFMPSGKSVLGAIEYDEKRDVMRCHECGNWFANVANHVTVHGKLTAREYRLRHGLRSSTSLANQANNARYRRQGQLRKKDCLARCQSPEFQRKSAEALAQCNKDRKGTIYWERRNETGRCRAQYLFKIQNIAFELKRTPTEDELAVRGIALSHLKRTFGANSLSVVFELIGLPLRKGGQPRAKSALLDDERMPWPKEYFEINPLEQRIA